MNKPFIRTVQAGAGVSLAAVIGMIANLTSMVQLIPIAMVTVGALGLIYMMDWLLASIERREQLEELARQRQKDEVNTQIQLEILGELRTFNRNIANADVYEQLAYGQKFAKSIEHLIKNMESIPDTQRLATPENEQTEASDENIPPEADSTESQSSNKKPPR